MKSALRLILSLSFSCGVPSILCAQDSPPRIVTQPVSRAVSLGANANLAVSALGTPPLHFQWRTNQTDLSIATNSSLNLSNLQFAQEGDYQVVVANTTGSVTSLVAHLA